MNQFIFCLIVDEHIVYGTLLASDAAGARAILKGMFRDRNIEKLQLKGIANKTYETDVMEIP